MMRTILIQADVKGANVFRDMLALQLPDFNVVLSINDADLDDIEVVIIWFYVPEFLQSLVNLKLLLICGSGVDHLIDSPNLPRHTPCLRLVDPYLRNRVSDYVIDHIVKQFGNRESSEIRSSTMHYATNNEPVKPKIGIMGLGLIGSITASKLRDMGYEVCGWVKTSRPRFSEVYVGLAEIDDFAKQCEVIVCQLPLTEVTSGILNSRLFNLLPDGAYLINVGRGAHVVEKDLLDAIDCGKLSGACLDVFEIEPLPVNHPFQAIPQITITPHIAGYVGPETQAPYAAEVINKYYLSGSLTGLINLDERY